MKIWLMTTEYPPFYGGGIGTYCKHTAQMFARYGHEVTVIVCDGSIDSELEVTIVNSIRIVRFRPLREKLNKYIGEAISVSYQYAKIVCDMIQIYGEPDIVESQEFLGLPYCLIKEKKLFNKYLTNVPIVVTAHTPNYIFSKYNLIPQGYIENYYVSEMEQFCLLNADTVIFPSNYLQKELSSLLSVKNVDSHIIPNPFEIDVFQHIDSNSYVKDDFVYVGRVQYGKGIEHLIQYFNDIWKHDNKLTLKILGGDSYYFKEHISMREYIHKKYSNKINSGNLIFEGQYKADKLYERISKCHAVIVPSLFENLPYVVAEAMSLAKVVIASSSGGQKELIGENERYGFIFNHDDPGTFVDAINKVRFLSADKLYNIGQEARQRIKDHLSYEKIHNLKMQIFSHIKDKHYTRYVNNISMCDKNYSNKSKNTAKLSVIIKCNDNSDYVYKILKNISAFNDLVNEVVLVSNKVDKCLQLAVEDDFSSLRVLFVKNKSDILQTVINSKGDFVLILEEDQMVNKKYIYDSIEIMSNDKLIDFVCCYVYTAIPDYIATLDPNPINLFLKGSTIPIGVIYRKTSIDDCLLKIKSSKINQMEELLYHFVLSGMNGVVIPKIWAEGVANQFNYKRVNYNNIYLKYKSVYKNYTDILKKISNNNHRTSFRTYHFCLDYNDITRYKKLILKILDCFR